MPTSFDFTPWPACLHNVAWSMDNIIAFAHADSLSLLQLPADNNRWSTVNLAVSVYGHDEVPLREPKSWTNFSIGEELSERHVTKLAWSPPGLGKHKSCLLAVLTSNHTLSLWECCGRPEVRDDWKRTIVVNHTIAEIVRTSDSSQQDTKVNESLARASRIRSFCWIPLTLHEPPHDGLTGRLHPTPHHLAIAAEDGYITVLRLDSPYDVLTAITPNIRPIVIARFKAVPDKIATGPLLRCLPTYQITRPPLIEELTWSPWTIGPDNTLCSTLAFICHDRLHTARVRALSGIDSLSFDFETPIRPDIPGLPEYVLGPLRWTPKPSDEGETRLVFFDKKSIYCLSLSLLTGVRLSRQQFDQAWDYISGLYFGKSDDRGCEFLVVSMHLTTQQTDRLVFDLPLDRNDDTKVTPSWLRNLADARALYSAQNGLADRVMTKIHGLDISPLGNFSTVAHTMHPSHTLEYTILARQICTLTISKERIGATISSLPVGGGHSIASQIDAGCIFEVLRRSLEHDSTTPQDRETLAERILRTMSLSALSDCHDFDILSPDASMKEVSIAFRRSTLYDRRCVLARNKALVELAQKPSDFTLKPDLTVVRQLVTSSQNLQQYIRKEDALGHATFRIHKIVLGKINARNGLPGADSETLEQDLEICNVCEGPISFESLRWARCSNGHQFPRCGLTFTAIQLPGKTKNCSLCNTQYLNQHLIDSLVNTVPALNTEDVEASQVDGDMWVTVTQGVQNLAAEPFLRILFCACDICIYCGGKFVG